MITEGQMRDRIKMAQMRWATNGKYWSGKARADSKFVEVPVYLKRLLDTYKQNQKTCTTLEAHYNLMLSVDEMIRNYLYEVWQKWFPPLVYDIKEMSRWRDEIKF
jgi:hypothetical protein